MGQKQFILKNTDQLAGKTQLCLPPSVSNKTSCNFLMESVSSVSN